MQQYEYQVFEISHALSAKHGQAAAEHLDKHGKEGWRLVSTVFVPDTSPHGEVDNARSAIRYYTERPLQSNIPFR